MSIFALLIIILSAPFHFSFQGEFDKEINLGGKVTWAGGLVLFEMLRKEGKTDLSMGFLGYKKKIHPKDEKESTAKKSRSKEKNTEPGNVLSYISRQLFAEVKSLLNKLLSALHLHLNVSGSYGFDDPSLTGIMMGTLAALNIRNSSLNLKPDFTTAVFEAKGVFKGWFIPLHILAIVIVFLFTKPVRTIWWQKIKFKKKQKEVLKYA